MRTLLLIVLSLLTGCAVWSPANRVIKNPREGYTIEIPPDWMRHNKTRYLFLSKDGPLLDAVQVDVWSVGAPFGTTKKNLQKSMLVQELADLVLDDYRTNPDFIGLTLLENEPAVVANTEGFKLTFTHRNLDGLKIKTMVYGFMTKTKLYRLRYSAPEVHYFEKEISSFESMISSFSVF
jgi:hypothetical protein